MKEWKESEQWESRNSLGVARLGWVPLPGQCQTFHVKTGHHTMQSKSSVWLRRCPGLKGLQRGIGLASVETAQLALLHATGIPVRWRGHLAAAFSLRERQGGWLLGHQQWNW